MSTMTKGLEGFVNVLSAQKAKLLLAVAGALIAVSCGPPVPRMDGTVDNPFNRPVPKSAVYGVVIAERSLSKASQGPDYNFAMQEPDGRCYGFETVGDTSLDSKVNVGTEVVVRSEGPLSPKHYDLCVNFHYPIKVEPSQVEVVGGSGAR